MNCTPKVRFFLSNFWGAVQGWDFSSLPTPNNYFGFISRVFYGKMKSNNIN